MNHKYKAPKTNITPEPNKVNKSIFIPKKTIDNYFPTDDRFNF